jgi:mono/diheme cytochrome c family protein
MSSSQTNPLSIRFSAPLRAAAIIVAFLLVLGSALFLTAAAVAAQSASRAMPDDAQLAAEVEAGLALFEERCATCHGPQGLGDGPLAATLPGPPARLGDPAFLRTAVPGDLFQVISNGRVERGMPPFGSQSSEPLSADDRWRLVAALYSLAHTNDVVALGAEVYRASCQECHGDGSLNDSDWVLSDPAYWLNSSDQMLYFTFDEDSWLPEHQGLGLSDEQRWAAAAYTRVNYGSPVALFQPLATASISGQVINGTTGEPLTGEQAGGLTATLRAFTEDLDVRLTQATAVSADGRYHFELADASPAWFFRVQVNYQGMDFAGDFGQLSHTRPNLELPVTVYDTTTDAAALRFEQIHLVIEIVDSEVQINELYVVSNLGDAVFVGESGDPEQGTVRFGLPPEAAGLSIQRGFGSFESFIPTSEVTLTNDGWAATIPVRPGQGSLTLLARYSVPYRNNLELNSPLYYDAAGITLVMRDVGVRLSADGTWIDHGQQMIGGEPFVSYRRTSLPAGSTLDLTFSGRSRLAMLVQDQGAALAVGAGTLLLVVALAAYVTRSWRREPEESEWVASGADADELLQAIAELDDGYEQGTIAEADYRREREELKAALREVWSEE